MKMKHSPSVAEILPNIDGLSDGASIGGNNDKSLKRGSLTRSPGRVLARMPTANEEDRDAGYGSLNKGNKQQKSDKRLKPGSYIHQNKIQILQVVQEDNINDGNGSQIQLPKSNFMQILNGPQYTGI